MQHPAFILCLLCLLTTGCGQSHNSHLEQEPLTSATNQGVEHQIEEQQVTATLLLAQKQVQPGETVDLKVTLDVAPLWEIRSKDAHPESIATKLDLELPSGWQPVNDWQFPKPGRSLSPDGHAAYAGINSFDCQINVKEETAPGDYPINCTVNYQACNSQRCLTPKQIELQVVAKVVTK